MVDAPQDANRDVPRDAPRDVPRDVPRESPRESPRAADRGARRDAAHDAAHDVAQVAQHATRELASLLPAGLRQDWPVPRQEVLGTRDGVLARLESALAIGAIGALARLPFGARDALVGGLARIAKAIDRSHSAAARSFLSTAFPGEDAAAIDARVLAAWKHFLTITIESEGFARHVDLATIRERFEVETCAGFDEVIAARRGSIFVTGHLGDWEAGSAILPWIGFDPLYVVARAPKNRPLSKHLQDLREQRGLRVLPRRGAMEHAGAVLRAGGTLGMLLDQRARKRPVLAPFFGRLARCDRSAGVLVRRLRAPVVVGACFRTGEPYRYRLVMSACWQPSELQGASPEEIATRINVELEKLVRRAPEQYFWLHDRYRGADEPIVDGAADA